MLRTGPRDGAALENVMMLPKDPPLRDRAYLDYLRSRPCLVTGRYAYPGMAVDPCHIGTAGRGIKSPDDETIPLLHYVHHDCHQNGEYRVLRHRLQNWVIERMRLSYLSTFDDATSLFDNLTRDWSRPDFMAALRVQARQEYRYWRDGNHAWFYGELTRR